MDYDWPGNVRELENVIERGVVLSTGPMIGKELVPEQVRSSPGFFHIPPVSVPPEGINLREVIAGFERRIIESTLETTGGVQKDAARLLGLKPTTLNEMIKRHSIPLPRDRERRERAPRRRATRSARAPSRGALKGPQPFGAGQTAPSACLSLTSGEGIDSLTLIGGNYRT